MERRKVYLVESRKGAFEGMQFFNPKEARNHIAMSKGVTKYRVEKETRPSWYPKSEWKPVYTLRKK